MNLRAMVKFITCEYKHIFLNTISVIEKLPKNSQLNKTAQFHIPINVLDISHKINILAAFHVCRYTDVLV